MKLTYNEKTDEKNNKRAFECEEEFEKRKKFFAGKFWDSTKSLLTKTVATIGIAFVVGVANHGCNNETQSTKDTQEEVVKDDSINELDDGEIQDEVEVDEPEIPSFCKTVQEEPLNFDLPRTSENTSFSISYLDDDLNLSGDGGIYSFVYPEESIMLGTCDNGGIAFLFLPNRDYTIKLGALAEIKNINGSLPSMDGTKCNPLPSDTAPLRSVKDGENEIKKGITKNINYGDVPSQATAELGSVASIILNVDGSQHSGASLAFRYYNPEDADSHIIYATVEEGELLLQLTSYSEVNGILQEKDYTASITHPAASSKTVYAIIANRDDLAHSISNEWVDPLPDPDYNAILFCGRCSRYTTIDVTSKLNVEQIKRTTADGNSCPDSVGFDITCEEPTHGPGALYYIQTGSFSLSATHVETESPMDIQVNFTVVRDNVNRDYGEINFIHIDIPCTLTYTVPKIDRTFTKEITISSVLVDPEAYNNWDTSFPNEYAPGGKCYDPVNCSNPDVQPL